MRWRVQLGITTTRNWKGGAGRIQFQKRKCICFNCLLLPWQNYTPRSSMAQRMKKREFGHARWASPISRTNVYLFATTMTKLHTLMTQRMKRF